MQDAVLILAKVVAFALCIQSIVLHEVAHAVSALRLGDDTGLQLGRITLNPAKHIDPFRTIMLPLLTFFGSGGMFMFGGAKPVPVNPLRFRKMRLGMMITGMAGPLTNVAIWFTCCVILRIPGLSHLLRYVFSTVGMINLWLVVFNMLPVPGLDGSRLVAYLLPREMAVKYERLEPYGLIIILIIVMMGLLGPVYPYILRIMYFVAGDGFVY